MFDKLEHLVFLVEICKCNADYYDQECQCKFHSLPMDKREEGLRYLESYAHLLKNCDHSERINTNRTLSNGVVVTYSQCLFCGQSHARKKQQCNHNYFETGGNYYSLESFVCRKRFEIRNKKLDTAPPLEYSEYLKTPEWKAKRKLVIERCGNLCEGCRKAPVDDVHHLTYQNITDELLFQLVGLCRSCHKKVHFIEVDHE